MTSLILIIIIQTLENGTEAFTSAHIHVHQTEMESALTQNISFDCGNMATVSMEMVHKWGNNVIVSSLQILIQKFSLGREKQQH